MTGSEDRFLAWLRQQPGTDLLGNDAAELVANGPLIATVDSQIAGIHFPPDLDPYLVGRRLFRVNASDLAAMGARPTHGLLALSAPVDFDRNRLLLGLLGELLDAGAELAGGDLARSPTPTATLTLLGTLAVTATAAASGQALQRNRARAGQTLWVGATLGESALGLELLRAGAQVQLAQANLDLAGITRALPTIDISGMPALSDETVRELAAPTRQAILRHLLPTPQLELGRWLAAHGDGAALDISDGLVRDLPRLCAASGVGATVDLRSIPVAADFDRLARALRLDPDHLTVGGGEDYALLFTLDETVQPPEEFDCTAIGRITQTTELVLLDRGEETPWPAGGWDHLEE